MSVLRIVLAVFCVWRVTHLLNAEDGPWRLFAKLRRAAGSGRFAELLDCFYCLSLWVAAPLSILLAPDWTDRLLLWPALSAGAIVIERLTARSVPRVQDFYVEDPEEQHVLR